MKIKQPKPEMHHLLHSSMVLFDDIWAGSFPLRELVNDTRPRKFGEFVLFLKSLEIYGSGLDYEPNESVNYKTSNSQEENTIKDLSDVREALSHLS